MDRTLWAKALPVALGFVLLALVPLMPGAGASFYIALAMKIMIFGVFALSLELLVGQTGLSAFGHAGFFGIGA